MLFSDPIFPSSDDGPSLSNPSLFITDDSTGRYACKLCSELSWMSFNRAVRHEDTEIHVRRARSLDLRPAPDQQPDWSHFDTPGRPTGVGKDSRPTSPLPPSSPPHFAYSSEPEDDEWVREAASRAFEPHATLPFTVHGPALDSDPADQLFDDFSGTLASEKPELPEDHEPDNALMDLLFPWDGADNSVMLSTEIEESDSEDSEESDSGSEGYRDLATALPFQRVERKNPDAHALDYLPADGIHLSDDEDWWPWKDQKHCLMDVLGAFPRAVFSESELDVTRWFATKLGVRHLPSAKSVKKHRDGILVMAGSQPKLVQGSIGHLYSVAKLSRILEHEMANPLVRPHLKFYPEESYPKHSEARHGTRWRQEVDANHSGPMARAEDGQDYYVDEPALANTDTWGTLGVVWPTRWFQRGEVIYARVHRLTVNPSGTAFRIEGDECFELPLSAFFLSFERFAKVHNEYKLPAPTAIEGIHRRAYNSTSIIEPCDVPLPNPWRVKAKGRRVLVVPMWLYCDDTSGNVSKKWNKHNSFLFILAGLPQEFALLPYNIHFLSTSNIAPPLEMLEEIVKDILEMQTSGLDVWDCIFKDHVLILPWILAMLGDNPMSSEFASHIGLTGKFFCRVCHARGKDKDRPHGVDGEVERVQEFIRTGQPRTRQETLTALEAQIKHTLDGYPSRTETAHTESGVKDKHFIPIYEEMAEAASVRKEANRQAGQPLITGVKEEMQKIRAGRTSAQLLNPIFQLEDIDPNADTPVEILHVVLLGVVKYFWRDAVSRQNSSGKALLKMRLSSLDVADLGLARLRGGTLVQYAGSLTGRDFRVVVQVAVAALGGMLPEPAWNAWLALGRLAPVIFQSRIQSLPEYIEELEARIDEFLAATAVWNTRWFNKPKFHILLHAPQHIVRLAPSPQTATEGFESYNLVIRLRSIHSNRLAPSVDISAAMSFVHAVRHVVSGGFVFPLTPSALRKLTQRKRKRKEARPPSPTHPIPPDLPAAPRQAGRAVLELSEDNIFVKFMGMQELQERRAGLTGTYKLHLLPTQNDSVITWTQTAASQAGIVRPVSLSSEREKLSRFRTVGLENGDVARLSGFVLYRLHDSQGPPILGRVGEILCTAHNIIGLMVTQWDIGAFKDQYAMPAIRPSSNVSLVAWTDILCCAHTFHNCSDNNCQPTRTRRLRQERTETSLLEDELVHTSNPDDRLLNTSQLRSAIHYDTFRHSCIPNSAYHAQHTVELAVRAEHVATDVPLPEPVNTQATNAVTPPKPDEAHIRNSEARHSRTGQGSREGRQQHESNTTPGPSTENLQHGLFTGVLNPHAITPSQTPLPSTLAPPRAQRRKRKATASTPVSNIQGSSAAGSANPMALESRMSDTIAHPSDDLTSQSATAVPLTSVPPPATQRKRNANPAKGRPAKRKQKVAPQPEASDHGGFVMWEPPSGR